MKKLQLLSEDHVHTRVSQAVKSLPTNKMMLVLAYLAILIFGTAVAHGDKWPLPAGVEHVDPRWFKYSDDRRSNHSTLSGKLLSAGQLLRDGNDLASTFEVRFWAEQIEC